MTFTALCNLTNCIMMGTEIIYQRAHLSDFFIKTFKTFLKTMRKKKNFQGIYRKLFYGTTINHITPFYKIL